MSLPPVPDFKVHVYEAGWRVPSWKPWLLSAISFWQSWRVLFTESAGQRHLPLPPSASRVHATCMFVHVAYGEVLVYPGTLLSSVYTTTVTAPPKHQSSTSMSSSLLSSPYEAISTIVDYVVNICLSVVPSFFFHSLCVCARARAPMCTLWSLDCCPHNVKHVILTYVISCWRHLTWCKIVIKAS